MVGWAVMTELVSNKATEMRLANRNILSKYLHLT